MTAEQIIAEIEALVTVGQGPDGYATMEEMADAAALKGKSKSAVQKMVKAAAKSGRLHAAMVPRRNIVGHTQRIVAYRILPE